LQQKRKRKRKGKRRRRRIRRRKSLDPEERIHVYRGATVMGSKFDSYLCSEEACR
jgi:hypothetical protein